MIIIWTNNSTLTFLFLASFLWFFRCLLVPKLRSHFDDLLELRWPPNDVFCLLRSPYICFFFNISFFLHGWEVIYQHHLIWLRNSLPSHVHKYIFILLRSSFFICLHSSSVFILLTFDLFFIFLEFTWGSSFELHTC